MNSALCGVLAVVMSDGLTENTCANGQRTTTTTADDDETKTRDTR